ncbi:MAG: Gx transporter family protein [Zetaproteobacteria bacterium]|nr:MAG: Gx transporter family protein [Zetaproteobacteria bacterium]
MNTLARPPREQLTSQAQWLALLLLATALHVLEASLPSLGPWFKPGLANLVTLVALSLLGPKAAFNLALWRVILGSLFIGTLFTPTFIMSLSGALAAVIVMLLAHRYMPYLSLVGISLLGATAHMTAQFVVVELLFIQQSAIYLLLPALLLLSAITGWINGALASYIAGRVHHA